MTIDIRWTQMLIAHGLKSVRFSYTQGPISLHSFCGGTPYEIAMRDKVFVYHLAYNPDGKLATYEKIKP